MWCLWIINRTIKILGINQDMGLKEMIRRIEEKIICLWKTMIRKYIHYHYKVLLNLLLKNKFILINKSVKSVWKDLMWSQSLHLQLAVVMYPIILTSITKMLTFYNQTWWISLVYIISLYAMDMVLMVMKWVHM